MVGWGKIGVQRASVLYPNSCYNEPCYIEVQVYLALHLEIKEMLTLILISLWSQNLTSLISVPWSTSVNQQNSYNEFHTSHLLLVCSALHLETTKLSYRISSLIRRSFCYSKTIPKI